ncbi:MAG: tetratricopeptide repeat protein [Verrucomicrobiaceae bacterium]
MIKKLLLAALLPLGPLLAQEEADAAPATEEKKALQYQIDLDNLPADTKEKYWQAIFRAETLFRQKRIFECLEIIDEVHAIYDKNPSSLNLKGACFVEFRNFKKAETCFIEALKQHPDNKNVIFNLAEMAFVTHQWQKAHDQLSQLLSESDAGLSSMVDLIKFKILLCKLKLGDKDGAKAILDETDFLDDSPLYYYGHGALAYANDEPIEAEIWLARASRIFRNPQLLSPWQDTLIEFGYIKSFYGGDLEIPDSE